MMMLAAATLVVALACSVGEPAAGGRPEPDTRSAGAVDTAAAERVATPNDVRAAASLLERAGAAYEHAALDSALEFASRVMVTYGGTPAAAEARWVAARAAFSLGRYAEARTLAERYADDRGVREGAADTARTLATLAGDAMQPPTGPAVVGAVLPRTGSRILVRYADWVLDGIRLAVQEAERRQGRRIELVVADDAGGARTREAMAEVEGRGAVAVVGPLMPQQLSVAAGARRDDRMVLVSPTIPVLAVRPPRTYTISGSDVRGAEDLGQYAAQLSLGRAAVLYLNTPEFQAQARAFALGFGEGGGRVVASVPYDSGTTTFGEHFDRVLNAVGAQAGSRPFALFVASPARDVPQIAPQVSFYGLDSLGVQVLGGDSWTGAAVRRIVPARDLEGVLAVSHFPPGQADGLASPSFVRLYEDTYRHSLNNQLPALGYDAANLVLQALPGRDLTPEMTARRFDFLAGVAGATGVLSVRDGQVIHTPYLVAIHDGELVTAPAPWEYGAPGSGRPPDTMGGSAP